MNPSLVDYLKGAGQDSSLTSRAKLAAERGLVSDASQYISLASQGKNADINTKLLQSLQTTPVVPSTETSTPGYSSTSAVTRGVSNLSSGPMTGSAIEKSSGLPEPTNFVSIDTRKSLSDMVSEVAKTTMSSNQLEIDNLRKALADINTKEKDAAQAKVDKFSGQLEGFVGTTDAQDALKINNEKFRVEENIALYTDIQSRIVAATEALNMGLIYEAGRPARMKFITGSESLLQKQGLATIGALQGTAAVIKGNLDLAKAFGDATINAINQDNETSIKALTTLLDLANNDLVDLKDNERTLINDRLGAIEAEATRLQKNKDDVLDLMTKYPKAFAAGGVTLLDTKEQALQKMLPTMAADERRKFEADLSRKTEGGDEATIAANKALLLQAKSAGMTYDEAVLAFGDVLPVEDIAEMYGRKAVTSSEDIFKNAYYNQFLDPATGQPKAGVTVSIDDKGNPVVKQEDADGPGFWSQVGGAFKSLFK